MTGLLIEGALIISCPSDKKQHNWFYGDIAIKNDLIIETGQNLRIKYPNLESVSGKNSIVLPGLVNCHTHAAMTLLRGYADDLPLEDWLKKKIWPREAFLTANDVYWGSKLAILEMIKSGTTSFADMYFFMEEVAKAASESGIRAVLARGMIGYGENGELAKQESINLIENWHNQANGRITCMLGPHALYTCPPKYIEQVIEMSQKYEVGVHIHLSETLSEVRDINEKYKTSPVELVDALGLLDKCHVLAAHCVHLSEKEQSILIEKKVGIAHNPQSNMKLASGVAPISSLLSKGAIVGLGTDGASSNDNLDLLEEMRSCALLQKVYCQDPTVLPADSAFEMATVGGAQALGLNKLGRIEVGCKADIIMMDLNNPAMVPLHNPISNLVYAANSNSVHTVIIDGRIVMRNHEMLLLDEEQVLFEAQRAAYRLVNQ